MGGWLVDQHLWRLIFFINPPIGLIGIIYESRPNVTADAAALCLKSGNAAILRGGSEALQSNLALWQQVQAALVDAGLPADAVQLVQRYLKDVGIEAEMKMQEYGAYIATTFLGKFEGMAMGPVSITWEPDSVLYGLYAPDQPRNSGHVNDPKITAMLKEQRRTKDRHARKQLIFDIQRYIAEQQY